MNFNSATTGPRRNSAWRVPVEAPARLSCGCSATCRLAGHAAAISRDARAFSLCDWRSAFIGHGCALADDQDDHGTFFGHPPQHPAFDFKVGASNEQLQTEQLTKTAHNRYDITIFEFES
jgi:hypothetical protein